MTRSRALVLSSGLLLLLAVKGDGHFPLPATTPEPVFQLYGLGVTLLFGGGLAYLLAARGHPDAGEAPPLRVAAAICACFLVLDGGVVLLEARRYAAFGYAWRPLAAMLVCLVPAGGCGWLAVRRGAVRPGVLLSLAVGGHVALGVYAWACFPLAAARSDMLPLLMAAGRALVAGHDPYGLYHLVSDTGVQLTYLPGLLLAYVPAALLHLDPRLIGLAYTVGAAGLLYRRGGAWTVALLSPFWVNPYLIYRHEVYLAPFWLLLAACWAALARPRPARLAACCGALALTSQLLAIPAGALAIFGCRRFGRGTMLRGLAAAAAVGAAVTAAFLVPDAASFVGGVAGHWQEARNVETLGISYWLLRVLSPPCVHVLQLAAIVALLAIPRSGARWLPGIAPDRPASTLAAAALALFAFAALNTVIWTYFYLPVVFVALLALLPDAARLADRSLDAAPADAVEPLRADRR